MTNLVSPDRCRSTDPFERLLNGFLRSPLTAVDRPVADAAWMPAADVEASGEGYRFRFDIPGVDRNDIDIQVENNVLTVRGERHRQAEGDAASETGVFRRETSSGKFARSFRLPKDADVERIQARTKDGVLTVDIPKSEGQRARKIEIEAS